MVPYGNRNEGEAAPRTAGDGNGGVEDGGRQGAAWVPATHDGTGAYPDSEVEVFFTSPRM